MYGCLFVVMLALLCSSSGKVVVTVCHSHSGLQDRQLVAWWKGAGGLQVDLSAHRALLQLSLG